MFIEITLQGITPLMCDRFTDEAADSISKGTRGNSAAKDKGTPTEQAEKRLYTGLKGNLIIPSPNVLRCIAEGGKFMSIGRSKVTTQKSSLIYACVSILDTEIEIESPANWRVDTRSVVIPATQGRILAHRPVFDNWELNFEVELDLEIMSASALRECIDHAGKKIGLGAFRPDRKGMFGKFVVKNWNIRK